NARPQDDGRGYRGLGAELRSNLLFCRQRLAEIQVSERGQSRFLQAGERADQDFATRTMEGLLALEDDQRVRPRLAKGLRGRGLLVQWQVHVGAARGGSAMEAMHEVDRCASGHGFGETLC